MNKKQAEILKLQVKDEEKLLKELKGVYETAAKDIDAEIARLLARKDTENLQSIIYQVQYQKALKAQINGILDAMNTKQFDKISEYLTECYEKGFLGTLYDLQGQGVPLVFPIDQEQVTQALTVDSKLSKSLYESLGEDVTDLKKRVRTELSRGISQAFSYEQIAKNIRNQTKIGFNRSMRIARTEGHRIAQQATFNAQHKAKAAGADIVKQWDSTLDGRTRPMHRELDGQIRELDDPFEVGIFKAQHPSGFGVPFMDIQCRCCLLQRAKWALEDDEYTGFTKWDGENGVYTDLSDAENYAAFKEKYKQAIEKAKTEEIKSAVWTQNDDGSFTKGIVKHQAQYKLDIDDDKVWEVNTDEIVDMYDEAFLKKDDAYWAFAGQLTPDDSAKFTLYTSAGKTGKEAFAQVLQEQGYKGLKFTGKGGGYLEVLDDSLITKTKKSKYETLSSNLLTNQKKLAKIDTKTYSGIWYNQDVTVADYAAKKSSIAAKKQYYIDQIDALAGDSSAAALSKIAQYKAYLDDLDEFEELGQQYEKIAAKISKIKSDMVKYAPRTSTASTFDGDAYSQARKDAANWFTDKNGSTKEADKHYRTKAGEVWRGATKDEKDFVYEYTRSYSQFNEPLRGYIYGTNQYVGVGNVDLDDIGVAYKGYKRGEVKKKIDAVTSYIDKSFYDEDMWLQRGCGYGGMDKFFGIDSSDWYLPEKELAAKLMDKTPIEHAFMSTAVSKGKGFDHQPIILNIYAPRGTKMAYLEPISAFGHGDGRNWDGKSGQSYFGGEAEMLLQRGTQFRVKKVEKSGGKIYIDLDIIGGLGDG